MRETSFLLILLSSFLMLVIYVTNPSLNKLSQKDSFVGTSPAVEVNPTVEIMTTGDVMLGRTVMTKSLDENDPAYPFRKVGEILKRTDLFFINLENPIVTDCPRQKTGFKFCAREEMVEGLTFAGVDIASVANNHTRNYGQDGLEETTKILKENKIDTVGLGNFVIKKKGGMTFGFLGFDFFSKDPKEEDFNLIEKSDKKVDTLFVSVHWGMEYKDKPSNLQRKWAKKMVEKGADVIIGHGPHWVQEREEVNGIPVYYSLGNFVFDQMWSEKTREGIAVKFVFKNKNLIEEEKLPVFMTSWAQPEFIFQD